MIRRSGTTRLAAARKTTLLKAVGATPRTSPTEQQNRRDGPDSGGSTGVHVAVDVPAARRDCAHSGAMHALVHGVHSYVHGGAGGTRVVVPAVDVDV